jgi:hypothetical protein
MFSITTVPCLRCNPLTLVRLYSDEVGRMMTQLEDIANSATITMHAGPRTPRVSDIQSVVALQQRRLSSNTHDRRISSTSGMGPSSFPSLHENLLEGGLDVHASPQTSHGQSTSNLFSPVSGAFQMRSLLLCTACSGQRHLSSMRDVRSLSSTSDMGSSSFPALHENHLLEGLDVQASPQASRGQSTSNLFSPVSGAVRGRCWMEAAKLCYRYMKIYLTSFSVVYRTSLCSVCLESSPLKQTARVFMYRLVFGRFIQCP